MSTGIIVSYDGTPNDEDGLALGGLLARTGTSVSLAYVRHAREFDPGREAMAEHDAERLLEIGARSLGMPDVPRHIVVSASTGEGLGRLAADEDAEMIVFGSDYRTAPGRVEPGNTAQFLLNGGRVAVAVAPAGLRARTNGTPGCVAVHDEGDPAARATAEALASALGAELIDNPQAEAAGLVVLGCGTGAAAGQVVLSGTSRNLIDSLRAAVLVVPRGTELQF